MTRRLYNMIGGLLLLATACNPLEMYDPVVIQEQFHAFEAGWNYDEEVPFTFEINDTDATYNLVAIIRHTRQYPYRNFWLQSEHLNPAGESNLRRHEIYLSNPAGVWFGTETGGTVNRQERIMRNTRFPQAGTYTLNLRHDMRDDLMSEVQIIGIRLEKNR